MTFFALTINLMIDVKNGHKFFELGSPIIQLGQSSPNYTQYWKSITVSISLLLIINRLLCLLTK